MINTGECEHGRDPLTAGCQEESGNLTGHKAKGHEPQNTVLHP